MSDSSDVPSRPHPRAGGALGTASVWRCLLVAETEGPRSHPGSTRRFPARRKAESTGGLTWPGGGRLGLGRPVTLGPLEGDSGGRRLDSRRQPQVGGDGPTASSLDISPREGDTQPLGHCSHGAGHPRSVPAGPEVTRRPVTDVGWGGGWQVGLQPPSCPRHLREDRRGYAVACLQ